MEHIVSKSKFKPRALKYFRQIEKTGKELIITDHARPVIKIVPYRDEPQVILKDLRNSIQFYYDPLEPVAENDWEALK
ncbi:MAG: type II toxin-antitoxin system Phd/YefM family antitoxin [Desulfobacula sp.]|uniref:type II toxin-antitoxin system Phd/YefM family antitoxin n=1 Tax=Desulfobacula sp. TaxID=2593537 RepID=UPI0025C2FCD5|nr:type II toxin-antitoxin system Phd/YefM family antitoxin [Desulfobacula sp.]MCD4718604.1 type II toxin-antitoxin system Phd/YefM family antitoxin [Desulfobacula sp.]